MLKRSLFIIAALALMNLSSFAQRTKSVGMKISTEYTNSLSLEYWTPVKDQLAFRAGAGFGVNPSNFSASGRIIAVTDSSVTQRYHNLEETYGTVYLGLEKQRTGSLFSYSGDLIVSYGNWQSSYQNSKTVLDEDGEWVSEFFSTNGGAIPTDFAHINRHHIYPGVRAGGNLNLPVGENFMVNLFLNATFRTRIFLGEYNVLDPLNEFGNGQTSTIDFDTTAGIGIRYQLPFKKKKKEE